LTIQPMMTRLRVHFALIAVLTAAIVPVCEGKEAAPIQVSARATAPTKAAASPAASSKTEGHRIIAVGDLHGDLARARESLRLAGVIDASDPTRSELRLTGNLRGAANCPELAGCGRIVGKFHRPNSAVPDCEQSHAAATGRRKFHQQRDVSLQAQSPILPVAHKSLPNPPLHLHRRRD